MCRSISNSELIKEKTGSLPTLLRPVGGGVNDTVKAVAKEAGLPIINWSVDTQDWKYRDAAHVKQVIVEQAGDGDVVLMHDLYPTSVQGALDAIDELQKRTDKTYAFVTVSRAGRDPRHYARTGRRLQRPERQGRAGDQGRHVFSGRIHLIRKPPMHRKTACRRFFYLWRMGVLRSGNPGNTSERSRCACTRKVLPSRYWSAPASLSKAKVSSYE